MVRQLAPGEKAPLVGLGARLGRRAEQLLRGGTARGNVPRNGGRLGDAEASGGLEGRDLAHLECPRSGSD